MQYEDMVSPIENLSDEELRLRIIELKKRREREPTKKKLQQKHAVKKQGAHTVSTVGAGLNLLSPQQLDLLAAELEGRLGK